MFIITDVIHNIKSDMRILILAILLAVAPVSAIAFDDIPLGVDRIDVSAKRRSHNTVIAAAQDSDGYIWLASLPGLYVYDGNLARPVLEDLLQGTRIRDMHIDTADTLWLATNSGVLSYSLKTQTARWYRDTNATGGLASEIVHSIYEDSRGTLWVGTAGRKREIADPGEPAATGLHRYEPSFDRFERVQGLGLAPDDATVMDIREDPHRNIWLATDKGLYRLNGHQGPATRVPLSSGEEYSAKKIAFDTAGDLWTSVLQRGLWTIPAGQDVPELRRVSQIPGNHIQDLQTDAQGDILICSDKGLFRHATREARFYRHPFVFSEQQLLSPDFVMSVLETASGNLWIGTINQGVLRHVAHPGARISKLALQAPSTGKFEVALSDINHVTSGPDSRVYVSPKGGGVFRSKTPVTANSLNYSSAIEFEPFLPDIKIKSMDWSPEGRLVCGLDNALLLVAPDGSTQYFQVKPEPHTVVSDKDIDHVICMGSGEVWFATKFELFSWRPGDRTAKTEMTYAGGSHISCLHRQGASIWVGRGQSVTVIDTKSGGRTLLDLPQAAWTDGGSIKNVMVEGQGTVWIATTKNVLRFEQQSGSLTPILSKARQRIAHALSFWRNVDGSIWIHTQDTIYRIAPGADLAEEILLAAPPPSGSISSDPAFLPGRVLAYGHTDGLLLVNPESIVRPVRSIPKISEVRIFGTTLPTTRLGRMPDRLQIDHHQNYLTFTFSLPEASSFHPPHFFYFLEGVDAAWNDAGPQKTVSYAHLKPGHYTLHVKDGYDGEHVSALSIAISEPWWMTTWTKAGYALAFVLTVLVSSRVFAHVQTTRIRREMLENLVMQDPLTEVPNRRKFKEVLAAEKSRCKRSNHQISVLMIDIDFFKGFNDRFGHQAGDKALKSVARTLSSTLRRPEDFVARFGGEEFVIVLPSTNRAGAERVAQKIQDAIFQAAIPYPGSPLSDRITLSIGISTFSPQTDLHIDSGLFSADQALYQAKRNGRNCVFYKDHCLSLTPVRQ
jgi:diguanylate cyclase (GGDEF)-like protein